MKIQPHLNYGGNCAEAFRFYEKHLGGKITMMMMQSDLPDNKVEPELEKAVLYANITIGDSHLSGNDVQASRFLPMRSAYLEHFRFK